MAQINVNASSAADAVRRFRESGMPVKSYDKDVERALSRSREGRSVLGGIDREWKRIDSPYLTDYDPSLAYNLDPMHTYPDYVGIDNSALYKQQAEEKAARIRAAIQRSRSTAEGNIQGIESQYGTAIQTAQNQGAQLPAQFTQLNNQASNRGFINAQRIRNAMAQMGLGQSGESASQQLQQGIDTSNQINANNQQLQRSTTDIGTQVTGLQGEKAAKVAAIRQAIADAEAAGDENAALALSEAQARIAAEASQNAVARNNWNLSIADKIRAAKETASTNAWNRGGFDSAYDKFKAEEALRQANELEASEREYANRIRLAQEEARLKPASTSGGLTSYQQYQIGQEGTKTTQWVENEATSRAKSDSRLADADHPPDGVNYFTLAQLIDAHRRDLTMQIYGY